MATKQIKKIGEIPFEMVNCSKSQIMAKKNARAVRSKGHLARVLKNGDSYCVYASTTIRRKTTKKKK